MNPRNADNWKCDVRLLQSPVCHEVAGGSAIAKMGGYWLERGAKYVAIVFTGFGIIGSMNHGVSSSTSSNVRLQQAVAALLHFDSFFCSV